MNIKIQKLGFTAYSEKLNGRVAMLGIILIIVFEIITRQNILLIFNV